MRSRYFHIRTSKFPILPGESEEIVNPHTYGKAFAEYLQAGLVARKWKIPFVFCEDWGWWVEIRLKDTSIGLLCVRASEKPGEADCICITSHDSATDKKWSWRRFRMVDIGQELRALVPDLEALFKEDPDIIYLGNQDEIPKIRGWR